MRGTHKSLILVRLAGIEPTTASEGKDDVAHLHAAKVVTSLQMAAIVHKPLIQNEFIGVARDFSSCHFDAIAAQRSQRTASQS